VEQQDESLGATEQSPDEPSGEMAQVAQIAHDLNNVLNVMLIYSELLDRSAEGRAPQHYVHEVREAAERGADLTGRLRRISRGSS
jgi:signal transduction histidine kinase